MVAGGLRAFLVAASLVALSCAAEPVDLIVDLKTDYVGGVEVNRARAELLGFDGAVLRTAEIELVTEDLTGGVRLADLGDIEPGTYELSVTITGPLASGGRIVRVALEEASVGVTVVITRDCATVMCPSPDAPALSACLGSLCVSPACTPENPAACPPVECEADAECMTSVACAEPACLDGVCSARPGEGCAADEYCEPTVGCRPRDGVLDTGRVLGIGRHYSCVLTEGGVPYCVGRGREGQLGDGGADDQLTPVATAGLNGIAMIVGSRNGGDRAMETIGSESRFACALHDDGRVSCWGDNSLGQLGTGTTDDALTPTPVMGIDDASWATAGSQFACAITGVDVVRCWGQNDEGQHGEGAGAATTVPSPGLSVAGVVEIDAGAAHVCALTDLGEVVCWGYNSGGRAASGAGLVALPTRVEVDQVIGLSAGARANCVLRSDTTVWCWGVNEEGQLGRPSGGPLGPGPVDGLMDAAAVTVSHDHACALRSAGDVVCWGSNQAGNLGDGTMRQSDVPVGSVGVSGVIEIAAGAHNTCARTADAILCWGQDADGELGRGVVGVDHPTASPMIGFPGY